MTAVEATGFDRLLAVRRWYDCVVKAEEQLSELSHLDELFGHHGIEYWLFGGWAVDFHAGK